MLVLYSSLLLQQQTSLLCLCAIESASSSITFPWHCFDKHLNILIAEYSFSCTAGESIDLNSNPYL